MVVLDVVRVGHGAVPRGHASPRMGRRKVRGSGPRRLGAAAVQERGGTQRAEAAPGEAAPPWVRFQVNLELPGGRTATFPCPADEYILDAAGAHGIELPYSCCAGTCSTCAARLLEGTVDQSDQNFLTDEQMDDGYVLLCTAFPTSDCIFRTHQQLFG